jgi:hypothetical protein
MTTEEFDRWEEIRFYYLCLHLYQIRHNMMDLMYSIETISQIGDIKIQRIKALAGTLLSDIGNTPVKDEVLYLAYLAKADAKIIKQFFGFTYRQMNYHANSCGTPYYYPKLNPSDNQAIKDFMKIVDLFKGGIL